VNELPKKEQITFRTRRKLKNKKLGSVLLAAKVFEKSIQHLDATQDSTNKTVTPHT